MKYPFLKHLGIQSQNPGTLPASGNNENIQYISSLSPIDGDSLGEVSLTTRTEYENLVEALSSGFLQWRKLPAPKRGEIVRQYGLILRENKEELGKLVSVEMGKSLQEGKGEVQEMIDIC